MRSSQRSDFRLSISDFGLFPFFLGCILLFLTACGPDYIAKKGYDLPETGWTYADTLNFPVFIPDTLRIYNLSLDIQHTRDFPFENLYVRIHTRFPDGHRLTRQVSLELADDAGLWQGDCGGRSCNITIPIQEGAYFNQTGEYLFTLEQYMRRDSLPGLERITFKVEDTGQNR